MQQKIQEILAMHGWNNKKIIVAVSGGADSMVLAELLRMEGLEINIAHCNFGLRNEESDGDEKLVRVWANKYSIPCHVRHFNTNLILETEGGNLQETARILRYTWFEELRKELHFDFIATAHHAQDSVETMLLNFFKGTGISGLHGILPQQNKIIRPLLTFIKEEIVQWATKNEVVWREDSSNQKDNYTRNAIRHHLLPVTEKIFPGSLGNLIRNTERFSEVELLYNESIERYRKKLIEKRNKDWYIPILKLRNCRPLTTILWELLKPFGFVSAQIADIVRLMDGETGKYISSPLYRIIHNRDFLIITAIQEQESSHILIEEDTVISEAGDFSLKAERGNFEPAVLEKAIRAGEIEAYIDANKLQFPLLLRPWKIGDYFYPIGMGNKKKKISRFLISEKLAMHEKEKVWVIESNKKIAWVVGRRLDERFKLSELSTHYVKFSIVSKR